MELEAKGLGVIPDSEVPAKVTRRRFTGMQESGKIGALLWREGPVLLAPVRLGTDLCFL